MKRVFTLFEPTEADIKLNGLRRGNRTISQSALAITEWYDQNGIPVWAIHRSRGYPVCGGRVAKRPELCCQKSERLSTGRCPRHGGRGTVKDSLVGRPVQGNPMRWDKYLPSRLRNRLAEHPVDSTLLDLTSEIQLFDLRIAELIDGLTENNPVETLKRAQEAFRNFQIAYKAGDVDSIQENLRSLNGILRRGVSDTYTWNELRSMALLRKELIQAQQQLSLNAGRALMKDELKYLVFLAGEQFRAAVQRNLTLENVAKYTPVALQNEILRTASFGIAKIFAMGQGEYPKSVTSG